MHGPELPVLIEVLGKENLVITDQVAKRFMLRSDL